MKIMNTPAQSRAVLVELPTPERAELSLADRLAVQRTELAVERTFLSHLRISLAMIGAALAATQLLGGTTALAAGGLTVLVALAILGQALVQKRRRQHDLAALCAQ